MILQEEGKPLFGALSSRQMDCLYPLVSYSALCPLVSDVSMTKQHCLKLLRPFLDTNFTAAPCILELDLFTILVNRLKSMRKIKCNFIRLGRIV